MHIYIHLQMSRFVKVTRTLSQRYYQGILCSVHQPLVGHIIVTSASSCWEAFNCLDTHFSYSAFRSCGWHRNSSFLCKLLEERPLPPLPVHTPPHQQPATCSSASGGVCNLFLIEAIWTRSQHSPCLCSGIYMVIKPEHQLLQSPGKRLQNSWLQSTIYEVFW